ncbi:uncharacterized protein LOC121884734 [Scomber scombrus]|uniref:Uncharacterized protein LOC121884734 n=1 Tax=Scomber scombrus TaxID=13677 RepID=A0AAV1Q5S9_SCOSC
MKMMKKKKLLEFAIANCEDETARRWLRENSESDSFFQLVDMFYFLKKHIDEEEKKDHSDSVHITFDAHGCISDSMIPASCLLPLSSITDVILYSPWNCTITPDVAYGVATGRIKPRHREFYSRTGQGCEVPDEKHRPTKLPDCWNSMKKAGDQKIPNITVSPMTPPDDGTWKRFESLKEQHGQPGSNRIVIPFIVPAGSSSLERVPFFNVTLALSLVLLSSRFEATVHLTACLSNSSAEKFDQEYLKQQYACCINDTGMKCSPDMLNLLTFQCELSMDAADQLINDIFSFVDLQKKHADKLNELANELEGHKYNSNVSKIVGSSLSAGGAAALTLSGLTILCTGGAAIPFLGVTGAIASGLGLATSIGSDVADAVVSSSTMDEAKQILERIQKLGEEIQELTRSLVENAGKEDLSEGPRFWSSGKVPTGAATAIRVC